MLFVIDGESLVGAAGFRSGEEGSLAVPGERGCGDGGGEDPVTYVLAEEGTKDLSTRGMVRSEAQTVSVYCIAIWLYGGAVNDDAVGGGWRGYVGDVGVVDEMSLNQP